MSNYLRLGDLLVQGGVITPEQLNEALALQKESRERLGTVLLNAGIITEKQLIDTLVIQLGVDFVDLTNEHVAPSMAQLITKQMAEKFKVVPFKLNNNELYLAMADPLNFEAIEEVRRATGKKIIPLIATEDAISRSMYNLYNNESASQAIEQLKRETVNSEGLAAENGEEVINENEINSAPMIRLVDSIMSRAVTENSSDVHIEPREFELLVRMRIDGIMHNIMSIPKELQNSVISRIKIMGDMDIAQRRIPQDGRSQIKANGRDIDLRISTLPTVNGEKVVIRLLERSEGMLSLDGLGFRGHNKELMSKLIHNNADGVILIVGPTGSGKSSTMYTIIRELNSDEVNIITLEDPVEYNIDGVNQVQINEKAGLTFANTLRSVLRQDPDIIGVGEIRDTETAQISMRAALTGHFVLSTLHTNDAVSSITRLLGMDVEPYLISDSVKGIISQRLVRRICPHCKKAYKPVIDEVKFLGLDPDKEYTFYKGAGCPECFDSGYRGRIGLYEILVMKPEIKMAILSGDSTQLDPAVKESGFQPIMVNAAELVQEGITTVSEVVRAIATTSDD